MDTPTQVQPRAYLTGTLRQPAVALFFDRFAVHARTGIRLTDWVKKAPSRRWDPALGCWMVTAFGKTGKGVVIDPDAALRAAGFTVDCLNGLPGAPLDASLHTVISLADLVPPVAIASVAKPGTALVRPRFLGWEGTRDLLGHGARWDKTTGRFEAPLTDLLLNGDPKRGLIVDQETVAAARDMLVNGYQMRIVHPEHSPERIAADAAMAALSHGEGETHDPEALRRLIDVVGDIPDWFGMDPYPYQRVGALAAVAGHNALADDMGLGKTVMVLAAFAVRGFNRAVIIVPPVVVTNWVKEVERTGIAVVPPKPPTKAELRKQAAAAKKAQQGLMVVEGAATPAEATAAPHNTTPVDERHPVAPPTTGRDAVATTGRTSLAAAPAPAENRTAYVVAFKAGRKEPELPEHGIAIVPDSLLAARPELLERLVAWGPDCVAYDEAHRARTWGGKRSTAALSLAERAAPGALRIPSTGTPMFSAPQDMAALLAFSGHLGPIFGGYDAYIRTYTRRNHFNAIVPRVDMLEDLREKMDAHVWVRRLKKDVLKDLPPKTRSARFVDVDLKGFRAAHEEVIEKIMVWLDEFHDQFGRTPNEDEAHTWAKSQIGLMSPLRKAAGLAKVPVALDIAADWVDEHVQVNADGTLYCERPLLLWAHHQDVVEALKTSVESHLKGRKSTMVAVIDGSTSIDERGRLVEQFQGGYLPVLICSITAAGVGITLTRSSDAFFIEADYSVPTMSQAEDRISRLGQTRPCFITTLVAEGTLDSRIQDILASKARIIEKATGGVDDVSVEVTNPGLSPSAIIVGLIEEATAKWRPDRRRNDDQVALG